MGKCLECGEPIPLKLKRHQFCSADCGYSFLKKQEALELEAIRKCPVCDNAVTRRGAVYCTIECRKANERLPKVEKTCPICGGIFFATEGRVLCGDPQCQKQYNKMRIPKNTNVCGLVQENERTRESDEKEFKKCPDWVAEAHKAVRREVHFYYITGQLDKAEIVSKMTSYDEYMDWWRASKRVADCLLDPLFSAQGRWFERSVNYSSLYL